MNIIGFQNESRAAFAKQNLHCIGVIVSVIAEFRAVKHVPGMSNNDGAFQIIF